MAFLIGTTWSCALSSPYMHSKVPDDRVTQVRTLVNPFPNSHPIIEEGRHLYEGKGLCVRCHGLHGNGQGVGSKQFHTPPRNFRHQDFWNHRSEGELFWTVKNGSPETGMLEFQSLLTDQEIWKILRYIETFPTSPEPPEVQKGDNT